MKLQHYIYNGIAYSLGVRFLSTEFPFAEIRLATALIAHFPRRSLLLHNALLPPLSLGITRTFDVFYNFVLGDLFARIGLVAGFVLGWVVTNGSEVVVDDADFADSVARRDGDERLGRRSDGSWLVVVDVVHFEDVLVVVLAFVGRVGFWSARDHSVELVQSFVALLRSDGRGHFQPLDPFFRWDDSIRELHQNFVPLVGRQCQNFLPFFLLYHGILDLLLAMLFGGIGEGFESAREWINFFVRLWP